MSTKKPSNQKKTVLDSLKEQLKPLTEEEGGTLSGGVASSSSDLDDIDPEINIPCNNKSCPSNTSCG